MTSGMVRSVQPMKWSVLHNQPDGPFCPSGMMYNEQMSNVYNTPLHSVVGLEKETLPFPRVIVFFRKLTIFVKK